MKYEDVEKARKLKDHIDRLEDQIEILQRYTYGKNGKEMADHAELFIGSKCTRICLTINELADILERRQDMQDETKKQLMEL